MPRRSSASYDLASAKAEIEDLRHQLEDQRLELESQLAEAGKQLAQHQDAIDAAVAAERHRCARKALSVGCDITAPPAFREAALKVFSLINSGEPDNYSD